MPDLEFRSFRNIRKRFWDDPRLIRMTLASVIAGTSIGVVGGSFRWCLVEADQLRDRLIVWSHGFRYVAWIIPVIAVLVSVAVARLLVQKVAPEASGSGILNSRDVRCRPRRYGGGHAVEVPTYL